MSNSPASAGLTYADAGVDIAAADSLIERIKPAVGRTHRPGVLSGLGGFGGMFELPAGQYRQPVFVSGTDGVGTKLLLAQMLDQHDTIGIDLVAMCVNDILVCGAEPLWFLDYFAVGKLDTDKAQKIIEGIAAGCEQAGAALLGGETAEMPGMYNSDEYDLGGFAVGVVEKSQLLDGRAVQAGDHIVGIASSGPHANGFSLIRKLLELDPNARQQHADALLAPTRIYVKSLLAACKQLPTGALHAMAHITGGGLTENLPRTLPPGYIATLDTQSWQMPDVFNWMQATGNITDAEMRKTFNCGIGMTVTVGAEHSDSLVRLLNAHGETASVIGEVSADTEHNATPRVHYQ